MLRANSAIIPQSFPRKRAGDRLEIRGHEKREDDHVNWRRLQAWVLRLVGAVELLAFGAVVMPRDWMQAGHEWLGMAELPPGPVFDSVMRQVSFTYGLHGVGMLVIASDVTRYRPMVVLAAIGYLVAGPVFILIDIAVGMPGTWIGGNGGSCLLIGTLLSALLLAERASARQSAP
jgi:hypothetical protein